MSGGYLSYRPTWEPLPLRCGGCEHEWQGWQPSNVAPKVWIAAIKALRCPACGAKRELLIRLLPAPPPEPLP